MNIEDKTRKRVYERSTGLEEILQLVASNILCAICCTANVVGSDVNELAPRPELHAADFLAAKLAYTILSFALMDRS